MGGLVLNRAATELNPREAMSLYDSSAAAVSLTGARDIPYNLARLLVRNGNRGFADGKA